MHQDIINGRAAHIIYRIPPKIFFLICTLCILLSWFMARHYYHDDAYITLKYALNFLNGEGLIWNANEPAVEGYSNFLFLMVVIALGYLGVDLVVASQMINVIAYTGIAAIMFSYFRSHDCKLEDDKKKVANQTDLGFAFVVCLMLFTADWNLVIWSLGGLESVFLSFLVLSGVILFIKYIESNDPVLLIASSVMLCLAGLTRLDAGILIAVSGLFLLHHSVRQNTFSHVFYFALPGLIFIPYFAGKYIYYGEFLPNTYFAKAGGMSLYRLFTGILYNTAYLLMPPCILSFVLFFSYRQKHTIKKDSKLIYLLTLIAVQVCYVLYSGGDHMPAFRFFVPVQPLILITLYHLLVLESKSWEIKKQKRFIGLTGIFIVLQFLFHSWMPITTDAAGFLGKMTGQYIHEHFPKGSLIALNTAGSTPYHAPDNTYIDMLGLNDPHIARRKVEINFDLVYQSRPGHNKGDGQYILDQKPDYIILGPAEGVLAEDRQWFLSGYELSKMDEFHRLYEPKVVSIDVSNVPNAHRYIIAVKNGKYELTYYQRRKDQNTAINNLSNQLTQ